MSSTKEIQHALNVAGASPALAEDGVFGPLSAAALKAFQASHGLTVDGIAGPITLGALGITGAVAAVTSAAVTALGPLKPTGALLGIGGAHPSPAATKPASTATAAKLASVAPSFASGFTLPTSLASVPKWAWGVGAAGVALAFLRRK